jgi:hypothetical protein
MDPITIIILVATLIADLSIGGAAWLLAKRQGTIVDQLTKAVTSLETIAHAHTNILLDHGKRLESLEKGE